MSERDAIDELISKLNTAENKGDREAVRDIRRYLAKKYGVDAYRDGRTMEWKFAWREGPVGDMPPGKDVQNPSDKPPEDGVGRTPYEKHRAKMQRARQQAFKELYGGKRDSHFDRDAGKKAEFIPNPARPSYDDFRKAYEQDYDVGFKSAFAEEVERRARQSEDRQAFAQQRGPFPSTEELERAMLEAIERGDLQVPDPDVLKEARRRMQEYKSGVGWNQLPDSWKPFAKNAPPEPPPPELPPDVHLPTEEETMASINEFFKQETEQ